MQILVLGMHRSGTSAVSRLLNMMGIYFAPEGMSTGANDENPKGFWERQDVRRLNDMLLHSAGADWHQVGKFSIDSIASETADRFRTEAKKIILAMDAHRPWFIKEPRLCLLAPLWLSLLEVPVCLFVYRSPVEVALSLSTRNGFAPEFSCALWERYLVDALEATRGVPRLAVSYQDLLLKPGAVVNDLARRLDEFGIKGLRLPSEKEITAFVAPSLHRATEKTGGASVRLTKPQRRLHEGLVTGDIFQLSAQLSLAPDSRSVLIEHDQEQAIRQLQEMLAAMKLRVEELERLQKDAKVTSEQQALVHSRELKAARDQYEAKLQAAKTQAAVAEQMRGVLREGVAAIRAATREQAEAELLKDKIREQTKAINARQMTLNQAIAKRDAALAEKRARMDELTETVGVLKKGLSQIEEQFRNLCSLKSFHFAIYTARRLGLISRESRRIVESIRNEFPAIRKALKQISNTDSRSSAAGASGERASEPAGKPHAPKSAEWNSSNRSRLPIAEEERLAAELARYRSESSIRNRWVSGCANTSDQPKVCLIVLHRAGESHLTNFFDSFLQFTNYPKVEFKVVLHACSDNSREVLKRFQGRLPIEIADHPQNFSFAYSNNRAAEATDAPVLIFANNDIIFQEDAIRVLVGCLGDPRVGLAGLRLNYPPTHPRYPAALQHAGIKFRADLQHGFYRPFNLGVDCLIMDSPAVAERFPALTGALLACRREDFLKVGGFHEGYIYGYEDVDLALTFKRVLHLSSISANSAMCLHDESATARCDPTDAVTRRRAGNISHLVDRHGWYLRRVIRNDKFADRRFYSDIPLTIGFAVTEATAESKAGDYFTASELAEACAKEFGWTCRYLSRKQEWYNAAGLDVLIVLVDAYDLLQLRNAKPDLLKIAWMRNWFERWAGRPSFDYYDLFLCSSEKAARWVRTVKQKRAWVFRLATNLDRFASGKVKDSFRSDCCFTGSYWQFEREVAHAIRPEEWDLQFAVFGAGWESHPKMGKYARGFVPYRELPSVYASTRLVIDDANHVTKEWGSVNSRVFDALAANALVITNGEIGAREVFGDDFPVYRSASELEHLVKRYLEDDAARKTLVARLRSELVRHHTYRTRARQLKKILIRRSRSAYRFALKIGAPTRVQSHHWGDYHFALSLGRALAAQGHSFRIDCLDEWERADCFGDDVVITLRGLSRYIPRPGHINLMWNISHPDKVEDEEYDGYDHVFVASQSYARVLAERLRVSVSPLPQCTDPEVFYPDPNLEVPVETLLFVGNSRKQFRETVRLAVKADLPVAVYGTHWSELIPSANIRGEYIENSRLRQYYSRCEILLNDHWPTMRESGFVSNRIFDGAAAGAFVLSDRVADAGDLFGEDLVTFQTEEEFYELLEYYLQRPEERRRRAERLRSRVLQVHTFAHRAGSILDKVREIDRSKRSAEQLMKTSLQGS